MKGAGGQMEEDRPVLPQGNQADEAGYKRRPLHNDGNVGRSGSGSWIPLGLLLTFLMFLAVTVWTLPAPTLLGKLDLLRQSWKLNAVLDESAHLREQIETAHTEKTKLQQELASQKSRSSDLETRLGASGGEAQSLRRQVADEQVMVSGLKGSNADLEARVKEQSARRLELLHKLQRVKKAELSDLAVLDEQATSKVAKPRRSPSDKGSRTGSV